MDGLLIDSEKVYVSCAFACSEKYGYGFTKDFFLSTLGLNERATKEKFQQEKGADFPFEEFFDREWVIHQEYLKTNGLQKKKGVDELLAYLDQKGIRKAIATSTEKKFADYYLSLAGLSGRFDKITYGDELTESKPLPQIYLRSIGSFGIDKDGILAFEDSPNGILSAYNAGLKVVHVPDLAYVSDEIKEKSFAVLDDLSQAIKLIEELDQ